MISPIVFQSLEEELKPILKYARGGVPNAGCGSRDLTGFLVQNEAASFENCARKTRIPKAVMSDLTDIPRNGDYYETIISNAVLEHVQFPDKVMQGFCGFLKPGCHLLLCVPFLQPYHPAPAFRRYSREGLLEPAKVHNFQVVEILPVHTIAQTITWIWWSYLGEKRSRLQLALLWLAFYLWCRFSCKTDFAVENQANSYQVVLRMPS